MAEPNQSQNGWNEWSRHVLKELERLNDTLARLTNDLADLKGKVGNYDSRELTRMQIQLEGLKVSDKDQEVRIRSLEQETAASQVNVTLAGVSQGKVDKFEKRIHDLELRNSELEKREAKLDGKRVVIGFLAVLIGTGVVNLMFDYIKTKDPQKVQHQIRLSEEELKALRLKDN